MNKEIYKEMIMKALATASVEQLRTIYTLLLNYTIAL